VVQWTHLCNLINCLNFENPCTHNAVHMRENTFKVLKEDPCIFSNYVEVQATWMFFQRNALILNAVMRPWVACALHYGCMDFQNSSR
jgi:hypothetical protein